MKIDKDKIRSILVISLSNIGDVILTTPVLSSLIKEFPQAIMDIMVGPKAEEIFGANSKIKRVITYNKFSSFKDKCRLVLELRKERYDLVIDLRNTAIPLFINAKYRTSIFCRRPKEVSYMKNIHLSRLKRLGINTEKSCFLIEIGKEDEDYAERLLLPIKDNKKNIIVLAPGARSTVKMWDINGFREVAKRLILDFKANIVFIGDKNDYLLAEAIAKDLSSKSLNLCGKTTLMQLAALLKKSKMLICNDSAPMHLATALDVPVIAIFGPTDSRKYGPRGKNDYIIKNDLNCSPCEKAQCQFNHECLKDIKPEVVIEKARLILTKNN